MSNTKQQPSTTPGTVVAEGSWGGVPWQFITNTQEPETQLCTAAFCIVTFQGRLVLVEHNSRGYEFAGGHINSNEAITVTVSREVREESRAVIDKPSFFGYKKVSPPQPIPRRDNPSLFYPFPNSYIPYYFSEATQLLENETYTDDIKSVRLATYEEALELLQPGHNHDKILNYLLDNELINLR